MAIFRTTKSNGKVPIKLVLILAICIGALIRIVFVLHDDFPINDGGMFFSLTQDLIQNHFTLPQFASYNLINIPYAYPPGGFYLLGFLNQTLGIDLFQLFRFVPLILSILILFLIYPIAKLITGSDRLSILTVFGYALLFPSYEWLVMGGGVARAPGTFFAVLAVLFTLKAAKAPQKRIYPFVSALSITASAYFHFETAFVFAICLVFMFFFFDRGWKILSFIGLHLLVGSLLLAPFLYTVISSHGVQTLISSFSSQSWDLLPSFSLLLIPVFTNEPFFSILAVFGFIGGLFCLFRKDYFPILWVAIIMIFDARSVHRSLAIPGALLIATGIEAAIFQGFSSWRREKFINNLFFVKSSGLQSIISAPIVITAIIFLYALILVLINQSFLSTNKSLSQAERDGMAWISDNTKSTKTFLTIPAGVSWERDWVAEWFPALTNRHDVLTVQGHEWIPGTFSQKSDIYKELLTCSKGISTCFTDWKQKNAITYDYLVWPKRSLTFTDMQVQYLDMLNGCELEYSNSDMEIYRCNK